MIMDTIKRWIIQFKKFSGLRVNMYTTEEFSHMYATWREFAVKQETFIVSFLDFLYAYRA